MGITAKRIHELKLIDNIVEEPMGAAHSNPEQAAQLLKARLLSDLEDLEKLDQETLLEQRYQRLMSYGYC